MEEKGELSGARKGASGSAPVPRTTRNLSLSPHEIVVPLSILLLWNKFDLMSFCLGKYGLGLEREDRVSGVILEAWALGE